MATVPNTYAVGYDYAVGGAVFHVAAVNGLTGINGVNEAVVSGITITVNQTGPTTLYSIAFKNSVLGSASVPSTQLYPTVDAALAAYRSLVLQY